TPSSPFMVGPASILGPSTMTWRRCSAIGTWSSITTSVGVDGRTPPLNRAALRPAPNSRPGRPAQAFRLEPGHARRALVRTVAGRELCHRASDERQEDDLLRPGPPERAEGR